MMSVVYSMEPAVVGEKLAIYREKWTLNWTKKVMLVNSTAILKGNKPRYGQHIAINLKIWHRIRFVFKIRNTKWIKKADLKWLHLEHHLRAVIKSPALKCNTLTSRGWRKSSLENFIIDRVNFLKCSPSLLHINLYKLPQLLRSLRDGANWSRSFSIGCYTIIFCFQTTNYYRCIRVVWAVNIPGSWWRTSAELLRKNGPIIGVGAASRRTQERRYSELLVQDRNEDDQCATKG